MKNSILFIKILLLLFCINISSKDLAGRNNPSRADSVSVMCSQDLYNLSVIWAREFNQLNPTAKIKVNCYAADLSSEINVSQNLGFISHGFYPLLKNKSVWNEVIGRDVIVPVINSENPFLREIYLQGMAAEKLIQIFTNPENRNWTTVLENVKSSSFNYYLINNPSINTRIINFLKSDQIPIDGITVANAQDMVAAIQKDPLGIGFCRLADIIDPVNQQIIEKITLMPIDRNFNGKIDYNEKIYDNLNAFTRGVWIGKYPKTLYSNIYAISPVQPSDEVEVAFMKWVLTDGQQFINVSGYSELALNERQSKADEFITANNDQVVENTGKSPLKSILLILVAVVVFSFILDAMLNYLKNKKGVPELKSFSAKSVFNENSIVVMEGLFFDKTHTWAYMKKNGLVKIGIDDFLQHITGTITQVKLKKPGDKIIKGEQILSVIHEGKQLNINAPVSGIIREQNHLLNCKACVINDSPYTEGWIYMIEPTNWLREIQFLILGGKYKSWLKDEFSRLRDFLSVYAKPGNVEFDHIILQDGGEISDNPLAELGPQIWEEFQTKFIDISK